MKKSLLVIICSITILSAHAQTPAGADTLWRKGGIFAISFNQVSLSNWAAGGENSVALSAIGNMYANYKQDRTAWDNALNLAYGLTKQGDQDFRKNDDKIDFTSKLGYDATKTSKWYYTFLLNFKSQFTSGYSYTDSTKTEISKFAAPAYNIFAIGMDFKPNNNFSLFISPITMRTTIVNDQKLADLGSYGVDPAVYDANLVRIKKGKMMRNEVGAYLNAKYMKDIMTNVSFMTKLDLFSNYQDKPQNVDVNWEVLIAMKVNKFITASINTDLIYDDNTPIAIYSGSGANKKQIGVGPRTQFKQALGVGFAWKFNSYGVKMK